LLNPGTVSKIILSLALGGMGHNNIQGIVVGNIPKTPLPVMEVTITMMVITGIMKMTMGIPTPGITVKGT
jgi:hypothetical protein